MTAFLSGLRVLDLSQYLPGPFATAMLAGFGADVVKVEPPAGDPLRHLDPEGKAGASPFYALINAGKRVVCLDLKTDTGKSGLATLVAAADVLLESYRPGVLDRLGFGEDRLKAINPRLVHCALSGFGQTGPLAQASGHDLGYVAATGTLSACGTPERPVMPFPPMSDHAGAMQAVVAILGALLARHADGQGRFLDVSMMESLLLWQAPAMTAPLDRGQGIINGGAAFYQLYATSDGRFVSLSPLEPKFWANFCTAIGRDDWLARHLDPMPQTALIEELSALFASRPLAAWDDLLGDADCCYQAVLDYAEVIDHPHVRARGLVERHDTFVDVRLPVFIDGAAPPGRPPLREVDVGDVARDWGC